MVTILFLFQKLCYLHFNHLTLDFSFFVYIALNHTSVYFQLREGTAAQGIGGDIHTLH